MEMERIETKKKLKPDALYEKNRKKKQFISKRKNRTSRA